MPKKKAYKTKEKPLTIAEPLVTYGKERITIFSSLEEQENDNYKWLASLTPVQHLQYATELIKRVFAKELKQNPTLGNRIKFK